MLTNEELINAQKFFKGYLEEEIVKAKDTIALNLLNYDITEAHLEQISKLNTISNKLTSLHIRLSDTLTDAHSLTKFLRKLSKKRQFNTLGFFVKYLNEEMFTIFINFLGFIGSNITSLKIRVKSKERETERIYIKQILQVLLNNNTKDNYITTLDLSENRFDTEENLKLLQSLLEMKQYKDIILSNKKMFENTLQCNLSNISNFYLTNCNINSISSLPLQTLNLSTNNLSKEGLEILSTLLSDFNTTITKLNLSDNYIGDDGCEILSSGLALNNSLVSINLSNNNILDRGCSAIARSLLDNKSIKKVNFRHNYIGNIGLQNFCTILKDAPKDKFSKLDFNGNMFSDIGLIQYAKFLSEHYMNRYLAVSGKLSDGGMNDFLRYLKKMNNLKVIDFYSMDLPPDTMDFLNDILLNNKNIQHFTLSNNKRILSSGMELLSKGLTLNTNLISIRLSQCGIGNEGTEIVANALFNNISIKEIYLDYNDISLNGTKALCEKVLRKRSLKILILGHNKIDYTAAYYIGKYLGEAYGITKLALNSNLIGDEGCEYISEGIKKNETLQELNIENNSITNKGIRLLSKEIINKRQFLMLNVSSNEITEIEDEFYELFDYLPVINIAANKISNEGIIRVFHGTEDNNLFKKIRLSDLEKPDEIFLFKTRNENLKSFDLAYNNINISLIKNILCLKKISFLNLQTNNINDDGINRICRFIIDYNSTVKSLHLQNNNFTVVGATSISEMLKTNKTIVEMNLADNPIKHTGINKICEVLTNENSTLKLLMVNFTGCNDYSANAINTMLRKNKSLIFLSLLGNNFSNEGIDIVLSALRGNSSLRQLSIGENKTSDKAYINLDKYLLFNKTLVSIEIKTSNLTDDFLNKVSKVFLNNKTIINFNLVNNDIGYDSICKLSLCLTKNNSINEVKLLLNQPNPEEREKLMSSSSHIIFN